MHTAERTNGNAAKSVKERVKWIDIYKGIAIIAMVLGHTSGIAVPYVYIFHMAAFFFISGYTEKFESKSLLEIAIAKSTSLLIPFFGINLFFIAIRLVMNVANMERFYYDEALSGSNVYGYIKMLFQCNWTTDWGGATWFLVALFFAFLFSKILILATKNEINWLTVLLSAGLLLLLYHVLTFKIHFGYFVDLSCIAAFYLILGSYCRVKQVFVKIRVKNILLLAAVTCLYLFVFGHVLQVMVDWPERKFNLPFLDMLSSTIAIWIIYNISARLENTKAGSMLVYLGQNSLGILVTHFLLLRVIFTLEYFLGLTDGTLLKRLTPFPNTFETFIYTSLVLLLFTGLNQLLAANKIYKFVVLGKYKCNISILQKYRSHIMVNILCVVLLLLFIRPAVPWAQIMKAGSGVNIESGIYEDRFAGEAIRGQIRTSGEGVIRLECYVTEHTAANMATISLNGKVVKIQPLLTGTNTIEVQAETNKRYELSVNFSQTFVANEVAQNGDQRRLSVVINKIEGR